MIKEIGEPAMLEMLAEELVVESGSRWKYGLTQL